MKNSSLVHIERGDEWLMMHRVKKENDLNKDKWIGLGGKFEDGESPEECALRECREEAGIILVDYKYRGIVTFVSDIYETEYMHLFTCDKFEFVGEPECKRGGNADPLEIGEKFADNERNSNKRTPLQNGENFAKNENSGLAYQTASIAAPGIEASDLPVCDEGELAWIKKSEFYKLQQWEGDKLFLNLLESGEPFFSMKLKYEGDTLVYAALNGKQVR